MADCKKGIQVIDKKLDKVTVDGNEYFFISTASSYEKPISDVHLLPIYDEFIMGYKDREAFFQYGNR